ncbi:tetratricopeptide repeat protein [Candidatus Velamenicoccus archaeovorus]|nr:tetratricopeptide repeat protein [Candidatus Velamenicoccus archaeovorus]
MMKMRKWRGIGLLVIFYILFLCSAAMGEAQSQASLHLVRGMELASQGAFDEARKEFEESLKEDPSNATLLSSLKVIDDLDRRRIGSTYAALLFKGLNYLRQGMLEHAAEELRKAIIMEPSYPRTYNLLGIVHSLGGDTLQARTDFQKALDLDPNLSEASYNLASLYYGTGDFQNAATYFEMAVKNGACGVDTYMNLGASYSSLKKYPESINAYLKATKLAPQDPKAFYSLGVAYFMDEEYSKSRSCLVEARDLFEKRGDDKSVKEINIFLDKLSNTQKNMKTFEIQD